jgi:UDP-N-acetylglucosamine acyltransferase
MPTRISQLSQIDPRAELGVDVEIGPFCVVGPDVKIGNGTCLQSHVSVIGRTTIGCDNIFYPNSVVGAGPQDVSFCSADTMLKIGDGNIFREGVTVNRGAEKEDGVTRIGNNNMLMANSHVAHNCHIFNDVILVNGVLLGGHVHVHDGAIVSGNSVVHHFSTLGTLAFISGGCRVPHDVPPYMLAVGSDDPKILNINHVGMRRHGINGDTIAVIKQAYRLLFRKNRSLDDIRAEFDSQLNGVFPFELSMLLNFVEQQRKGQMGRAREAVRDQPPQNEQQDLNQRRAA